MIGKRKRDAVVVRRTSHVSPVPPAGAPTGSGATEIFRKHFEANFDPLPRLTSATVALGDDEDGDHGSGDYLPESDTSSEDGDEAEDEEWSGIPEDTAASTPVVEVVDYTETIQRESEDAIEKAFHKHFMGSKPPNGSRTHPRTAQASRPADEDEIEEKLNLKNDIDLQRLLRESHLLDRNKGKSDGGAKRHEATEMRLQSLGSKVSLFTQEKMPMSHRKGISAKSTARDEHRRKEARESGIILERSSKKNSFQKSRRDRGVDVPVVGKFRGGTLQLSRKDVASIEGPRRAGNKKGRRR